MFGFADIQEPENPMDRVPQYARNYAKGPEFYLKTEAEQLEIIERIKARILAAMTDEWVFIDFDYYEGYRFLCPFLYTELQKAGELQCRRYYWGKCNIDYIPDGCDVLSGEHDPLGGEDCGYNNQYRLAGGVA
nr:hypothetical protein [Acinetobacter sp. YH12138]